MNLQSYQLIKEENWYYLSKKRLAFSGYTLNALHELNQWKAQTPSSSKVCSPASASKSELSDHQEAKSSKALSPLVLNPKEKLFDIAGENIGRSSPLTVKSECQSPLEQRRSSRESGISQEKRLSVEGISFEGGSLQNRGKTRDLVLKMKGSHESISSGERRRSNDTVDDVGNAKETCRSGDGKETKDGEPGKQKDKESDGQKNASEVGDAPIVPIASELSAVDSPSSAADVAFFSGPSSHMTSAVQSPVVSDVSIQLTKTDGRCEPFRSPERTLQNQSTANDSFDSEDQNEAVLKRCSSFAGFRSAEDSVTTIKDEESLVTQESSPEKGQLQMLSGLQGRLRHCSAPVSGHGTPRSKVSTHPYTPSCISSRGSFTEDGEQ